MPKKLFYIFFFSSHCPNFTFQVVKAFVFFHVMTTLQFHVVQGYEKFHILKFLPFPRTDKISFPRTDAPPFRLKTLVRFVTKIKPFPLPARKVQIAEHRAQGSGIPCFVEVLDFTSFMPFRHWKAVRSLENAIIMVSRVRKGLCHCHS